MHPVINGNEKNLEAKYFVLTKLNVQVKNNKYDFSENSIVYFS